MSKILKTVVIDDETIARNGIISYVNKIPFLKLTGDYASALYFIEKHAITEVDLLFLDIEMPGINGNEFLKRFKIRPLTIFVTAYPKYALEGYELDILDYLLKPVKFDRFYKACQKALDYSQFSVHEDNSDIWIKADNALYKILIDDIIYITSLQNYVQIHTLQKSYTILSPLKDFISQLPSVFIQSHKSYVINKNHIRSIEGNTVYLTKGEAIISRSHKSLFMDKVTS